jgi:hypothetical protein
VTRYRTRRLATVVSSALIGLLLLGTGIASANPPGWKTSHVDPIPADGVVAPSTATVFNNVGYVVTIINNGKSNITALTLTTDLPTSAPNNGSPTYVGPVTYLGQNAIGHCSAANDGLLACSFGSLNSLASVSVTVAYRTPTTATANCTDPFVAGFVPSTDCFHFEAFGNGSTTSDGGTSHGDALSLWAHATVSSSANFGGGFDINGAPAADNTNLGHGNVQSTAVTPPAGANNIAVTVEDGTGTLVSSACKNPNNVPQFGECSKINVNAGHDYSQDPSPKPFKVVITIYGGAVPGGTSVSDIYVLQTSDPKPDGTTTSIAIGQNDVRCSSATNPTNAEVPCIVVTKVGSNYQIVLWLFHNGGLHSSL